MPCFVSANHACTLTIGPRSQVRKVFLELLGEVVRVCVIAKGRDRFAHGLVALLAVAELECKQRAVEERLKAGAQRAGGAQRANACISKGDSKYGYATNERATAERDCAFQRQNRSHKA